MAAVTDAVFGRDGSARSLTAVPALARRLSPFIALAVLVLLVAAAHRELRAYRLHDIIHSLGSLSTSRMLGALLLMVLGHLVHVGYDALALRYAEHPLPWRRITFGSLVTYSLSAVTGFTGLVGASLRYRFWSSWGMPAGRIAEGVAFTALTAALGATATAGGALALQPSALAIATGVPAGLIRGIGHALLMSVAVYLGGCAALRQPIVVRGASIRLPRPSLAVVQVLVAALDWAMAGSVFYVLLPSSSLSLIAFLSLFVAAQVGGVVTHVPAGIGVFDGAILLLLRPFAPPGAAIAGLIAYRAVAYLLPALAAAAALSGYEIGLRRTSLLQALGRARRWLESAVPALLSAAAFFAGCVLLASGATPGVPGRLAWLGAVVPLGVIEAAHFIGSLVGVGLLILARGLHRRLDLAYHLAVLALVVGIGASLLKGGDFEEALLLAGLLALVVPARSRFYRRAALLSGRWSAGWLVAVALALGATTWLGFFSYQQVAYRHDLWWQFALDADAPRWLRASVGVAVLLGAAALWHLLGPWRGRTPASSTQDLERAWRLAYQSGEGRLYLALLGDKSLLLGSRGGVLMYAVSGRSWVALGDPVGAPEERSELVWRLKELADRQGGWPVFYEVGCRDLPLYVDLGLRLIKVGEEGRVPLATWSLEGSARSGQRRTLRSVERAGCVFDILPPEEVPALLPELERVSDAWLAAKHTREKSFSLGAFDERYLRRFPLAVVHREGRVVAFANLWLSATHHELSLDLMRYDPSAPRGIMEYVITRMILWGKAQGYAWFNLGMAPLSGLESRPLAPLWSRLGALAFRHGEHFYNFRGLRQYKEQFGPVWEPRFLAVPGGLALPRVLSNLATLISGGLTGVVTK
ncbi:MAG TPA: bifunctional lysylphosphatidylglycerol flippase/synthetase MprF [Gemmatimonadales bacterium]